MRHRFVFSKILVAALFVAGTAYAQSPDADPTAVPAVEQPATPFVAGFRGALYAGDLAGARAMAEAALGNDADDETARFAVGAAQFLGAVEGLGQGFYRHGLGNRFQARPGGMSALPMLRLPVPPNSDPDELTYRGLREILSDFATDLAEAERTLADVGEGAIDLPLHLGRVRLDMDADGSGAEHEQLSAVLATLIQPNRRFRPSEAPDPAMMELYVDFDQSDALWLQSYANVLMGLSEFILAHDWEDAFDATFPGLFPMPSAPNGGLNESLDAASGQSPPFLDRAEMAMVADLIAFIHLMHWDVAEPERMARVLAHFEAMVALSRENWERILAETDDHAEWLPGPHQTGALPGATVSQDAVDGWHLALDEIEAVLAGRKLLPHWRFDGRGINLRRLFLEPRTFDLLLLIQGAGAIPYLEEGDLTTGETWGDINRLLDNELMGYAIWFN